MVAVRRQPGAAIAVLALAIAGVAAASISSEVPETLVQEPVAWHEPSQDALFDWEQPNANPAQAQAQAPYDSAEKGEKFNMLKKQKKWTVAMQKEFLKPPAKPPTPAELNRELLKRSQKRAKAVSFEKGNKKAFNKKHTQTSLRLAKMAQAVKARVQTEAAKAKEGKYKAVQQAMAAKAESQTKVQAKAQATAQAQALAKAAAKARAVEEAKAQADAARIRTQAEAQARAKAAAKARAAALEKEHAFAAEEEDAARALRAQADNEVDNEVKAEAAEEAKARADAKAKAQAAKRVPTVTVTPQADVETKKATPRLVKPQQRANPMVAHAVERAIKMAHQNSASENWQGNGDSARKVVTTKVSLPVAEDTDDDTDDDIEDPAKLPYTEDTSHWKAPAHVDDVYPGPSMSGNDREVNEEKRAEEQAIQSVLVKHTLSRVQGTLQSAKAAQEAQDEETTGSGKVHPPPFPRGYRHMFGGDTVDEEGGD